MKKKKKEKPYKYVIFLIKIKFDIQKFMSNLRAFIKKIKS